MALMISLSSKEVVCAANMRCDSANFSSGTVRFPLANVRMLLHASRVVVVNRRMHAVIL